MGKNQGKTHKTDYETKMNDGTMHTGYKDYQSGEDMLKMKLIH